MANILQVTPPGINTENQLAGSQEAERLAHSPNVQNPAVPEKVNRADGQQGGKTGTATQDGRTEAVHYESNYGAFVKGLAESQENPGALRQLLLHFLEPSLKWAGQLQQDGAAAAFIMANKEDAAKKLKEQAALETRFSGRFFDGLRRYLAGQPETQVPQKAQEFLKAYTDYTAGPHLLRQMKTLSDDIEKLLLRQPAGEWKEMAADMDWLAPRGMTQENAKTINGRLVPFLASYISRSHDYGGIRSAAMLFIFHAARYENGSLENLSRTFGQLFALLQDHGFSPEEKEKILQELLAYREPSEAKQAADQVVDAVFRGPDGAGQVQQGQDTIKSLLVNESVFMPLLHFVFPFRLEGQDIVSEMWVDPDAGKRQTGEQEIKLLLKFDIRRLGGFELVMRVKEQQAGLQLYVPPDLWKEKEQIGNEMEEILKHNGFRPFAVQVSQRKQQLPIEEVFPEISLKERIINVRI